MCFVSGGNGVDAEHGESPFQIVFVSFRDRWFEFVCANAYWGRHTPGKKKEAVTCFLWEGRLVLVASNFQPAVYIYILYILISSLDIIYIYIYTLISESDVYPTVSDRIPIVVFNKHSQTSNVWCIYLHDIYHKQEPNVGKHIINGWHVFLNDLFILYT